MKDKDQIKTTAKGFSEKSRELLFALDRLEKGVVDTSDLTDETGYGNNTVTYHMKQNLVGSGMADYLGRDESDDSNNNPHQYRLTDTGHAAIAYFRDQGSVASTEDLTGRIDEVETTVGWHDDRISELEEMVEDHNEIVELVKQRMGG